MRHALHSYSAPTFKFLVLYSSDDEEEEEEEMDAEAEEEDAHAQDGDAAWEEGDGEEDDEENNKRPINYQVSASRLKDPTCHGGHILIYQLI